QRNAKKHLARMRKTGKPTVLTVNGKPEAVVMSAKAYEELYEMADRLETLVHLRESLDAVERGETIPLEEAKERFYRQVEARRKRA
ncbi:MAG: type II toxin-antitoxin system Phd/YefM family antitoxin, partial [Candidatus Methylomirabilis sp.]|nr:type II toxin-antitoxin system Phd/YefM family antitoxin [Deltaproteobacteria bacterium]